MASTPLVAKRRVGVVSEENDEKTNCLNNLKCRPEKPIYYHGDFSNLVWKVM